MNLNLDRLAVAAELVRCAREAYESVPWWRPLAKYRAWRAYEDTRFVAVRAL